MKSVFTVDDNGRDMEEVREFLRERGYSAVETSPEICAELRFTRFAVDRASVQVFWLTPDQRFIYVNDEACSSLGYSRAELTSMSVGDIDPVFPGPESDAFAEHWRLLKENGNARFETSHRTRDGRVYPVEVQSNFLEFEGKEYTCCFVTDISERKRAEEKLLLQHFCIEKSDTIVLQFSPGGEILMANESACRSLGYTADELLERGDVDITPVPAKEKKLEYRRILAAGFSLAGETLLLRKDGSTFPVEFTANKIDFHGKDIYVGFFRDITGRKKTQEALRESEKKFRLIIETSPNAVIVVRGERIVYANHSAMQVSGFTAEQLGSMQVWNFVHEDFREEARERILARLRGETVSNRYEYKILDSRGEERWMVATSVPIDYEGAPAILITIVDVTEVKQTEEALRESEARLKLAMDMAKVVKWDFDAATGMFRFDDQFYNLYGTTVAREGGMLMSAESYARKFVHPDDLGGLSK